MPKADTKKTAAATVRRSKVSKQTVANPQASNNLFRFISKDKRIYLIVLFLGLFILGYYKRSWFVAATINGSPISNLELLSRLNKQYRSQTLNQMIDEKIVLDEAQKKGVTVTPTEINDRIAKLEQNFGGPQTLDQLLTQQGQTRQSLTDQLKLQVIIEKLYKDAATISASEVDQFLSQNKGSLQSSDSAKQKVEAEETLNQQKLAKIFREKFQQLKSSAKIRIF